jgi:transaldolase/glucose-6-phosphate isomerase
MSNEDNPLKKLESYGQSIWLDYLRRGMIVSGELAQLIEQDGVSGVTSNPDIFEKAIGGSHDYDEAIAALALEGKEAEEIYWELVIEDVQRAADLFRPIYDGTNGGDGFVSVEVSPHLARDTEETIQEARRLWGRVDRPNVFIKVPGTAQGLPAIQQLISEGINVNVTLLFGLPRYREVMDAYISGLEARLADGKPIDKVASVASFFLSRINVMVDPMLEEVIDEGGSKAKLARAAQGEAAIASAKIAYQMYRDTFGRDRFKALQKTGAHVQRLLWASTSTKNPEYSDVRYVEPIIGPGTINTMPMRTLNAYRDHGDPAPRVEEDVDKARQVLDRLPELGIDIDEVTARLEDEGITKFNQPFDKLMDTLGKERQAALDKKPDREMLELGGYEADIHERIKTLEDQAFVSRLWHKDPSLWKKNKKDQEIIRNALGWLHVAENMEENLWDLVDFAREMRQEGYRHVVDMGMGGSSLAPLVFERTFSPPADGMALTVLDTTDPATILAVRERVPLEHTLFVVASKSGTTAEPRAFADYFYDQVRQLKGDQAGDNFIAITDPGSPLVSWAKEHGFRRVFLNYPDIGGRYSALSYFGMVPAALMGLDVQEMMARALRMEHACQSFVPSHENPGLQLGAMLGGLGVRGRNKVTFLTPAPISTLGMWMEQLLAESTGKEGTGLLPVAGEPIGESSQYGGDRLFACFSLEGRVDQGPEEGVETLRDAGFPMVVLSLGDEMDLVQEFFRWEFATAAAGSILGINAFNQPNVQESKDNTNRLLEVVQKEGELPEEEPGLVDGSLSIYADKTGSSVRETLAEFLGLGRAGDYVALMAYLTETDTTDQALQAIRVQLRDDLQLATTVGYGPRFLHSTGQFHKGGPNTGLFFQLTADDSADVPIPGRPYSFGVLRKAQALGDLQALRKHGRRVMRIHLGSDVQGGLSRLREALKEIVPAAGALA